MVSWSHITAQPGTLYLVGTPIGNLADLTYRAHAILQSVDLIGCEDTRHSLALLQAYEIKKPLVSLHEHNEAQRTAELMEKLASGQSIAYISDAGMPLISDPGQRLLHAVRLAGHPYEIIPGPTAPITALVGSGLPAEAFYFGGFLPVKSGQRQRMFEAAFVREETSIFFESPHRILTSLELLAQLQPQRLICVARELTKKFQEYHTATAEACLAHFSKKTAKGEIVLLITGTEIPKWMQRQGLVVDLEKNPPVEE
jgi:16S rRNA (cytidine1402-2'-O)-methyltransferase